MVHVLWECLVYSSSSRASFMWKLVELLEVGI